MCEINEKLLIAIADLTETIRLNTQTIVKIAEALELDTAEAEA